MKRSKMEWALIFFLWGFAICALIGCVSGDGNVNISTTTQACEVKDGS